MLTYQDYEEHVGDGGSIAEFIQLAIAKHRDSAEYKTALLADEYDHQQNRTILQYTRMIYSLSGDKVEDVTASNNKICSNFYHKLNTQRCNYLLGNGVSFTENTSSITHSDGSTVTVDQTKEKLGVKFDTDLKNLAYDGLIHGLSFGFWNLDHLHEFGMRTPGI